MFFSQKHEKKRNSLKRAAHTLPMYLWMFTEFCRRLLGFLIDTLVMGLTCSFGMWQQTEVYANGWGLCQVIRIIICQRKRSHKTWRHVCCKQLKGLSLQKWDFLSFWLQSTSALYQYCEVLKHSIHREMLIACIQELSPQTSRQDLRNVAMSQWFRPLLRPVRADQ